MGKEGTESNWFKPGRYEAVTYTTCRECGRPKQVEKPPRPTWRQSYGEVVIIAEMMDKYLLNAIHLCERKMLDGEFSRIVEYRNLISEAVGRGLISR